MSEYRGPHDPQAFWHGLVVGLGGSGVIVVTIWALMHVGGWL